MFSNGETGMGKVSTILRKLCYRKTSKNTNEIAYSECTHCYQTFLSLMSMIEISC